jgi:hypothetical protein
MSNFPPTPPPPGYPHASAGYGYAPPPQVARPPVWPWFVAYAVVMALIYLALAGFGVTIFAVGPEQFADAQTDADGWRINAIIFLVIGPLFSIPFAIAPFLPRKPWVWIYNLVLICLGLTSVCCLPATIPLLIYWLKPETKWWFGRSA